MRSDHDNTSRTPFWFGCFFSSGSAASYTSWSGCGSRWRSSVSRRRWYRSCSRSSWLGWGSGRSPPAGWCGSRAVFRPSPVRPRRAPDRRLRSGGPVQIVWGHRILGSIAERFTLSSASTMPLRLYGWRSPWSPGAPAWAPRFRSPCGPSAARRGLRTSGAAALVQLPLPCERPGWDRGHDDSALSHRALRIPRHATLGAS